MEKIGRGSLSSRAEEAIRSLIADMDLTRDNKLPREELLASQLGVSRTTIRQALNNLAAEGIVFRRQGKGTFVNVDSVGIRVTFSPCMELMQAIRNSGFEPSVRLLGSGLLADDENLSHFGGPSSVNLLREGLEVRAGEPLLFCDKVFLADGRPCVLCRDIFGASLIAGVEHLVDLDRYEDSVYRFINEQSGRRVEWDKVEIGTVASREAAVLFEQDASMDALKSASMLALHSFNYDQDDRPVLYAIELFDTSVIKFSLIRQKSISYQ